MIGTLRDYRFNKDVEDIRGSTIYGPGEEKLGKIDTWFLTVILPILNTSSSIQADG